MRFAYFSHVWGRPGTTLERRLDELWHEVQLAEQLGFDYAFSVEHHFTPYESWMPSPPVFCTGAAQHTNRIRIGPMGYVPALYHPLRVAEEVVTLDHVLSGRLEVGLTSGVTDDFFGPYGADFARRKELTRECIDLLQVALPAEGPFSFTGSEHQVTNALLSFGPIQRPHPPLWVPTTDRAMLRYLARVGAHTGATMIIPRTAIGLVYRHYVRWWQAAGQPGKPNIGYWTLAYVAETDEEALSRATPHIIHTLTKTLRYGQADDRRARAQVTTAASDLSTAKILERAGDIGFLLDHNLVFVGSPRTVVRQVREAAREGYFNTVFAEMNLSGMSEAELVSSVSLFGSEVMPALRSFEPY